MKRLLNRCISASRYIVWAFGSIDCGSCNRGIIYRFVSQVIRAMHYGLLILISVLLPGIVDWITILFGKPLLVPAHTMSVGLAPGECNVYVWSGGAFNVRPTSQGRPLNVKEASLGYDFTDRWQTPLSSLCLQCIPGRQMNSYYSLWNKALLPTCQSHHFVPRVPLIANTFEPIILLRNVVFATIFVSDASREFNTIPSSQTQFRIYMYRYSCLSCNNEHLYN